MQTSPVLNQPGMPPIAAPAKTNDAPSPATPFNQMLSREIAGRGDGAEAGKSAGQKETSPARQPDAAEPAKDAKPAAAGKQARAADEDKPADESEDGAAAAAQQAPADMLALVAGLEALKPQPADANAPALPGDEKAAAAKQSVIDGSATLPAGAPAAAAPAKQSGRADAAALDAAHADAGKRRAATPDDTAGARARSLETDARAPRDGKVADLSTPGAAPAKPGAAAPEHAAAQAAHAAKPDFAAELGDAKGALAGIAAATQPAGPAAAAAVAQAQSNANQLAPRVGTPAWDQALGQKVVWMVAGEQQSASLTLNPPDLGPLQVVLSVSNSTAHASFTAAQPEVRQALEAALPKLRDMLGEAGIQLGQATVGGGSPDQQPSSEQQAAAAAQAARRGDAGPATDDAPLRTSRVQSLVGGRGLVDTFV